MLRYNLQRLFNDQSSREVTLSHPVAMTNLQSFLEVRHHPVINQEMRGMGDVQQTKNFTAVHINALNRIRVEQAEPAHIPQPVPPQRIQPLQQEVAHAIGAVARVANQLVEDAAD